MVAVEVVIRGEAVFATSAREQFCGGEMRAFFGRSRFELLLLMEWNGLYAETISERIPLYHEHFSAKMMEGEAVGSEGSTVASRNGICLASAPTSIPGPRMTKLSSAHSTSTQSPRSTSQIK